MSGDMMAALQALDAQGIAWCVWKGSDHVDQSLAGSGDLDVLVDPRVDPCAVHRVLAGAGLRCSSDRAHPDRPVDDWFGLAPADASLVHLQLYRELRVDDGLVDRWHLPVEQDVLAGRRRHESGCWVAHPAHEVILLAMQAAARPDTLLRRALRQPVPSHAELRRRVDPLLRHIDVEPDACRWFGRETGALLAGALQDPQPEASCAWDMFVEGHLSSRTPSVVPLGDGGRRRRRVVDLATKRLQSAVLDGGQGRRRSRRLDGRGRIVAVVGSDGSGKSSLVADLSRQYGSKFDTRLVYFGSGDGHALAFFRPLKWARRLVTRSASPGARRVARPRDTEGQRLQANAAAAVWAVGLALERRRKAVIASNAREAGAVVLCDRYPQVEVPGIHDGPRLDERARPHRRWWRALVRWERRSYEKVLAVEPDVVLRLGVSPEVAARRRPDHDVDDLRRRIDVVARLRFAGTIVEVDADRPLEDVRRSARTAVFSTLP